MNYTKEQITKTVVNNLSEGGFTEILSKIDGYKIPFKIVYKGTDNGFQPDIIAVSNQLTHLFSVETELSEPAIKEITKKWSLFSAYAKLKKGNLYIVGTKEIINSIKQENINHSTNTKYLQIV